MADSVRVLSQGIEDEKSKIAVRQLEQLLQSALARITALEKSGGGGGGSILVALRSTTIPSNYSVRGYR